MLDSLRFVILRSFLGSICLFVQSYSSLYSFTHKQIDHQKQPRNLTKLIYRNALNLFGRQLHAQRLFSHDEVETYFDGFAFFALLRPNKSLRLVKSFFKIKPTPCVVRLLRVKYLSLV